MTNTELQTVRQAIALLHSLAGEPQVWAPAQQPNSIHRFVQEFLAPDADADLSCKEVWGLFQEVVQAGELPPMRKATFLRHLPAVIEAVFNVRKSHHIERDGRRVRGFKGLDFRMDADPPAAREVECEAK
jgi:hypothetical protein